MKSPPLNSLGTNLRQGVLAHVEEAQRSGAKAIVLAGDSRAFSGGADIKEFAVDGHRTPPTLKDLIAQISSLQMPTVAAIEGVAIGGGLELALACDARVLSSSAQCGLGEVLLGLLPGAGGTQRLPRLVGPEAALQMMTDGKPVGAAIALKMGLANEVVEQDSAVAGNAPTDDADSPTLTRALELATELAGHPFNGSNRLAWKPLPPPPGGDPAAFFATARTAASKAGRGRVAPAVIVDAVAAGYAAASFEEGLKREGELFEQLAASAQAKALQYAFFAEREMGKVPGINEAPRPVGSAAVVGSGTMGTGIAMCFANAGLPVTLIDMSQDALQQGLATIRKTYGDSVSKGKLSPAAAEKRLSLIASGAALDSATVGQADIVVEAVTERMGVKKAVFSQLDAACKPGAVLATNTSYLNIDTIASATARPQDVCGTHFFSPAHVMPLLENVRGDCTSAATVATVMVLGKRLRKQTVLARTCFGFIGNRCLEGYMREAMFLLEEGCVPRQVDAPLRAFGMAMGPLQMSDLSGNDIGYNIRKDIDLANPARHESERYYGGLPDLLVESGRLGQKTRKGWYDYSAGRVPVDDADVEAMVADFSRAKGIERRQISDAEVLDRCLLPLVNEGFKCVEEGIAQRESDVDMVYLHGYGWPRHTGGPLYWARHIREGGLAKVLEDLRRYKKLQPQAAHWGPSKLLVREAQA